MDRSMSGNKDDRPNKRLARFAVNYRSRDFLSPGPPVLGGQDSGKCKHESQQHGKHLNSVFHLCSIMCSERKFIQDDVSGGRKSYGKSPNKYGRY